MLGLSGSHRVGKTTLAKLYAEKHGFTFVQTSVSAIFKELGLDPAQTYDFATRLTVQEEILKRLDKTFAEHAGKAAITDRTPLDFLAYTMGDAVGHAVVPEDQDRFADYVQACFKCLNRHFSVLLVVQPGIALVHEEGKAAINRAYIEHLNSLIIGLSVDERVKVPHYFIPRYLTGLEERVGAIEFATHRTLKRIEVEREGAVSH